MMNIAEIIAALISGGVITSLVNLIINRSKQRKDNLTSHKETLEMLLSSYEELIRERTQLLKELSDREDDRPNSQPPRANSQPSHAPNLVPFTFYSTPPHSLRTAPGCAHQDNHHNSLHSTTPHPRHSHHTGQRHHLQ